jgi:hypothetical protein
MRIREIANEPDKVSKHSPDVQPESNQQTYVEKYDLATGILIEDCLESSGIIGGAVADSPVIFDLGIGIIHEHPH